MADKISNNVGKKIVEALKMHSQPVAEQESVKFEETIVKQQPEEIKEPLDNEEIPEFVEEIHARNEEKITFDINSILNNNTVPEIDNVFQATLNQNIGSMNTPDINTDFDCPNNVAILTHLISKLPAGVTKRTGAFIIRQTMEALGIPMKSVISEAQQAQEVLSAKARECQKNIIDYKKQIAALEIKGQQYQKQAVSMNDIINLFLNSGV